jgi:PmbA protein
MTNKIDFVKEKNSWENLASNILKEARLQGATSAEVNVSTELGFSLNVRMGEVETLEYNRDKGVSVLVYYGNKKGAASTTDTSEAAIKSTVTAACQIARLGSEDPCAGLADADLMANNYPDLDLYHPWNIQPEQAIEIAKECEDTARAFDNRIVNSEGAGLSTHQGLHVYGNTHGFIGTYLTTRHNLSCVLVAQDKNGMQRDYGFTTSRDPHDMATTPTVAREAAEKTVSRLGSRRLKTCQTPVIFRADVAGSLLGNFLGAISGGHLYRKASFLVDHIGKPVFSKHIQIHERAHIPKGLGSSPFDAEGVVTNDRELIVDGVLQGYLLGSYSARKLGMKSTGNAGGPHNILIDTTQDDLNGLLKKMGTGLFVTEVMGQGVNLVTGDYSRGAVGFWVEEGIIQYPVEEVTIAGNLRDMFKHVVAVANDIDHRSSILTGSILLENMTIAGE